MSGDPGGFSVFCMKCMNSGRSPFQMGRQDYYCMSCKASASLQDSDGSLRCRANPTHVLRPNIRCCGRGDAPCTASYLSDTDTLIRLSEPVEGECHMCHTKGPVMNERNPFAPREQTPIFVQESIPRPNIPKSQSEMAKLQEKMKADAAEAACRLYCRPCLVSVLSFRKVICAKCFPSRGIAEIASMDFWCTQCRSNRVQTEIDPSDMVVTRRCLGDPRHTSFVPCFTCTNCCTSSAREPNNFSVLVQLPLPATCSTPNSDRFCKGTRIYSSGCPQKHSYCIGCIPRLVKTKSTGPKQKDCLECNACLHASPFGPEEEAGRSELLMSSELQQRLEDNIAARCTCEGSKGQRPPREAMEPGNRPIVTCPYCNEPYCAVCTKKGGCSHSSPSYNLTEELRGTMIEWQCTRVPQMLAIFRTFTIVDRYFRGLDSSQRTILMRSPCPVLPFLDRYFRIGPTDCNTAVFHFSKSWAAITDEGNTERVRKLFSKLRIEPTDLKFQ